MLAQRRLAAALVGALVINANSPVVASSEPAPSNLLHNPGFESDRTGWNFGSIVTSPVHSGSKALQITGRSSGAQTSMQNVTVTGGTAYQASGWVKVANLRAGARVLIQWRNGSDIILRTDTLGTMLTGTAGWTRRSASLTAPAGATQARLTLRVEPEVDGAGQAWFDDLSFGSASSGPPDYVVEGLATSPETLTAGQLTTFTATVRNAGSTASVSSSTRLRLDVGNDGTFDVTPTNQATVALGSGARETETWSNAWTASAGTHRLEVCADVGSAVAETNETNNCTTSTFVSSPSSTPSPSPSPSPTPSSTWPTTESACATDGVRVSAGTNLSTVAAAHPAGTIFCLAEGTFVLTDKVVPQPGDAFIGAGRDRTFVRPSGASRPTIGFVPASWGYAGAAPITYRALDIGGFAASASTTCRSSCGIAIMNTGDPLTGGVVLRDVRCHDNGTACVAAGMGSVLAENIECDGNGFHPRSLQTDYRSSACIKMNEGSLTLRDSWIHDNTGDAIWCDWCGNTDFLIENNVIESNGRAGVVWEVSGHFVAGDHAIIRNNMIRNNGNRCDLTGSRAAAGVLVSNAQNITIEGNTFGGNSACGEGGVRAVRVLEVPNRDPANANIMIWFNTLNGDRIQSCTARGVSCR